jgi:hypothetical protein
MKRKILDEILATRPEGVLYHYTNQAGLLGIVQTKEIWATHTQYLNDAREFLHGVQMARKQLAVFQRCARIRSRPAALPGVPATVPSSGVVGDEERAALREMVEGVGDAEGLASINVCVASFSEDGGDSLSQWRAYAPRGGYSIGVRADRLAGLAAAHRFFLARCLYDHREQVRLVRALIDEVLEENIGCRKGTGDAEQCLPRGGNLPAYLNRYAPILKDRSFRDEREWRIISRPQMCRGSRFSFREGSSMMTPFYRFPIGDDDMPVPFEEVVVGPTLDQSRSKASVRSFLVSRGLGDVRVRLSAVPYRLASC